LRLAEVLRQEQVDIIQAHQYTPFFYALAARLRYQRPPIIFTEHGRHYPDYPRTKRMLLNRLALQPRDRVVAVGPSVKRALVVNEGIPASRIEVIFNGIDTEQYTPSPTVRAIMRKELGYGPDEYLVLMVARLDPIKDHRTAIRACVQAASHVPGLRLVLIGDGPERESIETFIREQRLEHLVRLLGTRDDVPRLLTAADTLLLTSVSEGVPLTLIEAMAAGVPVVSTNVGSIADIVLHGTSGLLAPARDHATLAEHLIQLGCAKDLRTKFGQAGRAQAVTDFSEARMMEQYCKLFEQILYHQSGWNIP
jgi:glycosyltransferase involved in cell wall biosynthesis